MAFLLAAKASLALVMSSGVLWSPGPLSCSYRRVLLETSEMWIGSQRNGLPVAARVWLKRLGSSA